MHSLLSRGNAIIAYSLSVLALLTFFCFLSTEFLDYRAKAKISTPKILVQQRTEEDKQPPRLLDRKNVPDYSASRRENDLGYITFDLHADLTPLFNWNVKQLFLYLSAEYSTSNNALNQVVLWDKIILRGENALLDFKNMNIKYYFWDDGHGLRGNQNVTLTLAWNIIPNAGRLPIIQSIGSHSFKFPSDYTTDRL